MTVNQEESQLMSASLFWVAGVCRWRHFRFVPGGERGVAASGAGGETQNPDVGPGYPQPPRNPWGDVWLSSRSSKQYSILKQTNKAQLQEKHLSVAGGPQPSQQMFDQNDANMSFVLLPPWPFLHNPPFLRAFVWYPSRTVSLRLCSVGPAPAWWADL